MSSYIICECVFISDANKHMQDMTHAFKSQAQKFVNDVITDSKKPEKPILKSAIQPKQNGSVGEPHTYREENRLSEYGKLLSSEPNS